MPVGVLDGERLQLLVGDLDALLVDSVIPLGADPEARGRRRRCGELDDGAVAGEGTATPVDGDEAEETMLDLYLHRALWTTWPCRSSTLWTCLRRAVSPICGRVGAVLSELASERVAQLAVLGLELRVAGP